MSFANEIKEGVDTAGKVQKIIYNPQDDLYAEAAKTARRQNQEAARVAKNTIGQSNGPTGTPGTIGPLPAGTQQPQGGVPMPGNPNVASLPHDYWQRIIFGAMGNQNQQPVIIKNRRGGRIPRYQAGGSVQRFQAGGTPEDEENEAELLVRSLLAREQEDERRQNPNDSALITNAPGDPARLNSYLAPGKINQQLNQSPPDYVRPPLEEWEVSAQPVRQAQRYADWQEQDRNKANTQALIDVSPGDTIPPRRTDQTSSVAGRAVNRGVNSAGKALGFISPDPMEDYVGAAKFKLEQERRDIQYNMFGQLTDEQYAARNKRLADIDAEIARLDQAGGSKQDQTALKVEPEPTPGTQRGLPLPPRPADVTVPATPPPLDITVTPGAAAPPDSDVALPEPLPKDNGTTGPSGTTASAAPPTNGTAPAARPGASNGAARPASANGAARPAPGSLQDQNRVDAFNPRTEKGEGYVDAEGRDIRALSTTPPPSPGAGGREQVLNTPASSMMGGQADQGMSSNNAAADLQQMARGALQAAGVGSSGSPPPVGQKAISQQSLAQIVRQNDGQGKFSPGAAALAGALKYYKYYLAMGDIAKANSIALGIVQAANVYAAEQGSSAIELLRRGDVRHALGAVVRGADMAFDGLNHSVSPDGTHVISTDTNGQVVSRIPADGRWILAAATGMANGTMLWQSLNAAAASVGRDKGDAGRQAGVALKMWQIEMIKERIKKMRADPKFAGVSPERLGIMALAGLGLEGGGPRQGSGNQQPNNDAALDGQMMFGDFGNGESPQ